MNLVLDKSMNVLFINNVPFNPKYGGVERVTDLLAKGLIALNKGYNIFYLSFKPSNSDMLNYEFPAKIFELPEYEDINSDSNKKFILKLISEHKIDIIVNQRGEMSMMNLILPQRKCKIVSCIHSIVDASFYWFIYGVKYAHPQNGILLVRYILKRILWPFFYLKVKNDFNESMRLHFDQLANISDKIVLLSPSYKPQLKKYVGEYNKITSIPNPNTFKVSEINPEEKENIVLFVGRLSQREKNPLRLLQIWRRIYKKHKDWKLVIVGDGADKELLQHYIEKHHICNVSLEGAKSNVEDYYRRASIVCLTSNYEGWGMALTEGMTFGCVPFTFGNYGAAYDIIDDGGNGYVIPAFDTNQYAKKLSEIMEDRDKRVSMAQAAQRKVQDFSIDNVALKWDELFKSLLK